MHREICFHRVFGGDFYEKPTIGGNFHNAHPSYIKFRWSRDQLRFKSCESAVLFETLGHLKSREAYIYSKKL